jgi:hypothetical protein
MNGPITRSRARQLNLQVRSTLVNCVSELTLGAMDVLMIRNLEDDQQGLGKGLCEREMCPWAISKYFGDLVSNTSAKM